MAESQLLITSLSVDLSKVRRLFGEATAVSWLYLGKDALKRRSIGVELGSNFEVADIARLHDEAANEIRGEHVEWIDALNRKYGDRLEWWFGAVSSRNIYSSNLFQYSTYLEVLERLWKAGQSPALIFAESRGLAEAVRKWAISKGIGVTVCDYKRSLVARLLSPLRSWQYSLKYALVLMLRLIGAVTAGIIYGRKDLSGEGYVVIDTFLHGYSLSKEGVFKDRYFPELHEYLLKQGKKVIVHPVIDGYIQNYFSFFRKVRISDTKFIISEDYLCLSDYAYALTVSLKVLRIKVESPTFRGFDISDIVEEDHREQSFFPAIEAAIIYRLFLRLGKGGMQIDYIIDWYENQVIDKALVAGVRKALPRTKIIGAQVFIHAPNFLNFFPCQSEVEAGMAPDLLLETSERQCKVAEVFTKDIPSRPAAALRYNHLYNGASMKDDICKDEEKAVVALLPFNLKEAVELLEVLSEALPDIEEKVTFFIKGHPDYSDKELISAFGKDIWPSRFTVLSGDLAQALACASLVVSSNSSSMVEAAAKGVPVIFVGRQSALNQNLLAGLDIEGLSECFNAGELVATIDKYLTLSPSKLSEIRCEAEKLRDLFFTPVSDENMRPFLQVNGER